MRLLAQNKDMEFCLTNVTLVEEEINNLSWQYDQKYNHATNIDLKAKRMELGKYS